MNTINYDQLIAVTAGDPAGVGPDICLELSNHALSNKIFAKIIIFLVIIF